MIELLAAWTIAAALPPEAAAFAGMYNGGRMEMAAGIELRADGRFNYGLSYGALDESAEGSWTVEQGQVLLTSDSFEAPSFALVEQGDAPPGKIRLRLDIPEGLPVQLFNAQIEGPDGALATEPYRLEAAEQELEFSRAAPPKLRLTLPMFEVRSEAIDLAKGAAIRVRFDPEGLGKVAFVRTPLVREDDALLLERHGEKVRFRRVEE